MTAENQKTKIGAASFRINPRAEPRLHMKKLVLSKSREVWGSSGPEPLPVTSGTCQMGSELIVGVRVLAIAIENPKSIQGDD